MCRDRECPNISTCMAKSYFIGIGNPGRERVFIGEKEREGNWIRMGREGE